MQSTNRIYQITNGVKDLSNYLVCDFARSRIGNHGVTLTLRWSDAYLERVKQESNFRGSLGYSTGTLIDYKSMFGFDLGKKSNKILAIAYINANGEDETSFTYKGEGYRVILSPKRC